MTAERVLAYVVVDTSVLSYFTLQSPYGGRYRELLGERRIALSYFAETELDGRNWGEQRRDRLEALYRECVRLPPGPATSTWYNRANVQRRKLRLPRRVALAGRTDASRSATTTSGSSPTRPSTACRTCRTTGTPAPWRAPSASRC